ITFGAGAEPADIDYDVGYPPDRQYMVGQIADSTLLPPVEGFVYGISSNPSVVGDEGAEDDSVPGGLIQFTYMQNQPLERWCAGQPPRRTSNGDYNCLGESANYKVDFAAEPPVSCSFKRLPADERQPVDCGRAFLCMLSPVPICECNPATAGCKVSHVIRP